MAKRSKGIAQRTRLRCAIYTRKSTEEGLEQDFNSLDAQREACEASVRSQAGEGWRPLPQRYDDGGHSGGTMERPALQHLLGDVDAGRIDIVVVYKVDRLTRSLADFAKIVERFDARRVSFVSVTQAFNTTTSMGRLTLNVLLSFAQFEREVTAERIRDKVAASKAKGIWMGGPVPIGYDVVDKRLVVNDSEAATVRRLFHLYLEERSLVGLTARADAEGLRTKRRSRPDRPSGLPFSAGHLRQLLTNPVYIGKVRHRGVVHHGEHEAIIAQDVFDATAMQLRAGAPKHRAPTSRTPHRLTGLVFDETGDGLTPSHARRSGRRYHYYVSRRLLERRKVDGADGWRLPAKVLDEAVIDQLRAFLTDPARLVDALPNLPDATMVEHAIAAAQELARGLAIDDVDSVRAATAILAQVDIAPGELTLSVDRHRLATTLFHHPSAAMEDVLGALDGDSCADATITIVVPWAIKKRGVGKRLILNGNPQAEPDRGLVALLQNAHAALTLLTCGRAASIEAAATILNLDRNEVSRTLPLAFLAPDITKAILAGWQPVELTAKGLARVHPLPTDWAEQRRRLGFPPHH